MIFVEAMNEPLSIIRAREAWLPSPGLLNAPDDLDDHLVDTKIARPMDRSSGVWNRMMQVKRSRWIR